MDMSGGYMDGWSDDDPSEVQQFSSSKSKRHKMEPEFSSSGQTMVTEYDDSGDPRQWTQQHLNAADIRNPDILACALTPPQVRSLASTLIKDHLQL